MYNKISLILSIITLFAVTSCVSSKATVSKNADLAKYRYASVINNDTYYIPAELMEYEIMLYDAVEESHLQLIGDYRINELTPQQQGELLLAKYGVSSNENAVTVTVNFIDYLTGRPVVSCKGTYSIGITYGNDIKGAIKQVSKQISATFPR